LSSYSLALTLWLDSVRRVLLSNIHQGLLQLVVVLSQDANGHIDHLNQERGVHQKAVTVQQQGRIRVDVQGEAKQDLGVRALFEKTAVEIIKKGREEVGEYDVVAKRLPRTTRSLCSVVETDLLLKEDGTGLLFVVARRSELAPAFLDCRDVLGVDIL